MTDIDSPARIEPMLDKPANTPAHTGTPVAAPEASASTTPAPTMPAPAMPAPVPTPLPATPDAPGFSQLARIEEKAARIEEKFARTEALMLRVETAATGLGDVARKSDVDALAERVRRLPGFLSLIVTALLTSVVTAAMVTALFTYVLR